jgi:hypothetical protein
MSREQRMLKFENARIAALAAEEQKRNDRHALALTERDERHALAAEEHPVSEKQIREISVSEGLERVTFNLTRQDYGFYCRSMVVLDIPPTHASEWYSERIAFYQSSATSNGPHYRYLRNTFFPTLGRANNDEKVPNLPPIPEESGDFFVKTGLFKTTLSVRDFNIKMEQHIPTWIDILLTDYCNIYYRDLLDTPRGAPIESTEDYVRNQSFIEATNEIYRLFDLCIDYFTSPWQIAMSIGLSRFFGNGVWVEDGDREDRELLRKFKKFADFIDTKYVYNVEGYKGTIEDADPAHATDKVMCRDFLSQQSAQCDFSKIVPLPISTISGNKFYVFTGRSLSMLESSLRANPDKAPKKIGGTKSRRFKTKRLFKTRRQKCR